MQPNNNRAPGQAGHPDDDDAGQGAFEPGASFTEESSNQGGTGELPSWLQTFAGAAGDADDAAKPSAVASKDASAPSSWDDPSHAPVSEIEAHAVAPEPHSATEPADQFGQVPGGADASFFSEDDLPEWLRALSTESEPAPGAAPVMAVASNTVTPKGAIQVPPVSRAWVTASDQPEVSPGANLLSSLVHTIDGRPDTVAVEPAVSQSAPPNARAGAKPQAAPAASEPRPAATATATESVPAAATRDSGRWSRARILAVAVVIILLLLVIVTLSGN